MNAMLRTLLVAAGVTIAGQALAEVTFYTRDGFRGKAFTADRTIPNLARSGFNDRISSVIVRRGNWVVCSDAGFEGRCVTLRPGRYPNLARAGIEDSISSVREVRRYGSYNDGRRGPYAFDNNRNGVDDRYEVR